MKRDHAPEVKARLSQMLKRLQAQNLRVTPQRIAVLRVLTPSEGHPTVEMVYKEVRIDFPTTSLATIYKTVSLLKEMDEPLESNSYDGSKPFRQPHVICTQCKKIIDLELTSLRDLTKEVMEETSSHLVTQRLDFFGLCPECRNKTESIFRPPD